MTLRRYTPLRATPGMRWPPNVAAAIRERDEFCVAQWIPEFPHYCDHAGALEIDHVRASHGTGMKSESTVENGVLLCALHHRWKTLHGKVARPLLLAYLARYDTAEAL